MVPRCQLGNYFVVKNDVFFSVMIQTNSEKEILSAPIRSRTQDLPITSSDALPSTTELQETRGS